ncbi:olfactory receptor 4A47-like, partial [Tachyglossus aculeatus]|uniref:olfactory receptor 4A47-like n=1 Tax=Tachyglossus aculeatus TaxID=9261 RepID=UPI0018F4E8AF
ILLGLSQHTEVQKVLFVGFFIIYMVTILGNLLIVVTIITSQNLCSPMYFFLAYLSLMDAFHSTATASKMIVDLLYEKKTISFKGCKTHIFLEHLFGGVEVFVLMVMAYDCYVAICKPLYYMAIMNQLASGLMVGLTWVGGSLHSMAQLLFMFRLPFGSPSVIDHQPRICDTYPLLELTCTATYFIGLSVVADGGAICAIIFLLLLLSYAVILRSPKSLSLEKRNKTLSTCISHITVVVLFFVPCIFMYLRPVYTLLFYTIVTPMLNPLIYRLRNAEVKNAKKKTPYFLRSGISPKRHLSASENSDRNKAFRNLFYDLQTKFRNRNDRWFLTVACNSFTELFPLTVLAGVCVVWGPVFGQCECGAHGSMVNSTFFSILTGSCDLDIFEVPLLHYNEETKPPNRLCKALLQLRSSYDTTPQPELYIPSKKICICENAVFEGT